MHVCNLSFWFELCNKSSHEICFDLKGGRTIQCFVYFHSLAGMVDASVRPAL